ncbi:MAG: hypothetical protein WC600_03795 [Desulfobaccales bacterium]
MMVRLLLAGLALSTITNNPQFSDPDANTAYIEAVIPEIQGIVRSKVNKEMVHGVIRTVVGGYTLGDPVMIARDLEELAAVEVAWVTAMSKRVGQEEDLKTLTRVLAKIKDLTRKEVIERELGDKLIQQLAMQLTTQTLLTEDVPVARLPERVDQILTSI